MRGVFVDPGNTLLTVMPNGASSAASVLDQLATAQRVVLETPRPAMGSFTEVEMMLTMRPNCAALHAGNHDFREDVVGDEVLAIGIEECIDLRAVRGAGRRTAGIVDQDVHGIRGHQFLRDCAQAFSVAGIGDHEIMFLRSVGARQFVDDLLQHVRAAGEDGDVRAELRQFDGARAPDPLRGAAHQCVTAGQVEVHFILRARIGASSEPFSPFRRKADRVSRTPAAAPRASAMDGASNPASL